MAEEKVKSKKKVPIIEQYKKPIIVGGFIGAIAIAGIISGIFLLHTTEYEEKVIVCGSRFYVQSLDPLIDTTFVNRLLWDNVAEGLFDYNQSKEDNPIIPMLASSGNWSDDHLNFTCFLRENVEFHDGTPFNATAVKWNFDRIHRLLWNIEFPYMFINSDGNTIINRTEVIDTYTVRFVLNKPYVPFRALLTTQSTFILSPKSTPADGFIDINSTNLKGTGPFKLESCVTYWKGMYLPLCINTTMVANPDYWGGKPEIDKIILKPLVHEERLEGMASGELTFVEAYGGYEDDELDLYENMEGVRVVNKTSALIYYIAMNNDVINVTMREAVSYAFNYSYFFEKYMEDIAERAKSPLSKGLLYSNWEDFKVPYYNITRARQTLIDANWNGSSGLIADNDISPGNPWEQKANSSTPLAIINFSYPVDDWARGNFSIELAKNLKQIGVRVDPISMTWLDFLVKVMYGGLDCWLAGWGPSFNDPVDFLNPLYSNKADGLHNTINFNDTLVQQWMEEALDEWDPVAREQLYYQIQERMIEKLYPKVWLGSPMKYFAWSTNLKGIPWEGILFKILFKNAYLEGS